MNVLVVDRSERWGRFLPKPALRLQHHIAPGVLFQGRWILSSDTIKIGSPIQSNRLVQFAKNVPPYRHADSSLIRMIGGRDLFWLMGCCAIGLESAINMSPMLVHTHDFADSWTL